MSNKSKKMLRRLRSTLSGIPAVYLPFARFRHPDFVVRRYTDIVIEGFPRSGNSFAEAAFRLPQKCNLHVAHHCHAASQVLVAAKWHVPTLVLIRQPKEAVRSLIMHEPHVFDAENSLREYIFFYKKIQKVRKSYVLANFESVISDFGSVINIVNQKFSTDFEVFFHDSTGEAAVYSLLNSLSRERGTIMQEIEPYSPTRTHQELASREEEKLRVSCKLSSGDISKLLDRAEALFCEASSDADI